MASTKSSPTTRERHRSPAAARNVRAWRWHCNGRSGALLVLICILIYLLLTPSSPNKKQHLGLGTVSGGCKLPAPSSAAGAGSFQPLIARGRGSRHRQQSRCIGCGPASCRCFEKAVDSLIIFPPGRVLKRNAANPTPFSAAPHCLHHSSSAVYSPRGGAVYSEQRVVCCASCWCVPVFLYLSGRLQLLCTCKQKKLVCHERWAGFKTDADVVTVVEQAARQQPLSRSDRLIHWFPSVRKPRSCRTPTLPYTTEHGVCADFRQNIVSKRCVFRTDDRSREPSCPPSCSDVARPHPSSPFAPPPARCASNNGAPTAVGHHLRRERGCPAFFVRYRRLCGSRFHDPKPRSRPLERSRQSERTRRGKCRNRTC